MSILPPDGSVVIVNGREYRVIHDEGVAFLFARKSFDQSRRMWARYVLWPDGTLTSGRDYRSIHPFGM